MVEELKLAACIFRDQLKDLRVMINSTQCGYIGVKVCYLAESRFEFTHLREYGDLVKIMTYMDGERVRRIYIDYRNGIDEINWFVPLPNQRLQKKVFRMDTEGISDEAFQELVMDVLTYLK